MTPDPRPLQGFCGPLQQQDIVTRPARCPRERLGDQSEMGKGTWQAGGPRTA